MAKATAADRAHFERIARAAAAIERTRQIEAAHEDCAAKIEQALRLSNAMLRGSKVLDEAREPKRFSLIARWRQAQARRTDERNRT